MSADVDPVDSHRVYSWQGDFLPPSSWQMLTPVAPKSNLVRGLQTTRVSP